MLYAIIAYFDNKLETQIATLILFCKDQFETTSKMEKTGILPALVLLVTITVCAGFPQAEYFGMKLVQNVQHLISTIHR